MAGRDHARITVAVWRDPDWRALSVAAQHMYLLLCSQAPLSYCGVMDWWPGRLAVLAADLDEAAVYEAVRELAEAGYVVLDMETSELCVRTYVRHDGVMNRANMAKAMGRALDKVTSLEIRETVLRELARMHRGEPHLNGWVGLKELFPKEYETVISMALGMGSE